MTLRLTHEQCAALQAHGSAGHVIVLDEESQRTYWLAPQEDLPRLWTDYLHAEVELGLAAIERGELVDWDPEAMKAR